MSMAGYSRCEGLYRVGDYVYMEINGTKEPLTICRLDSISKPPSGIVECAVSRFTRYRELSPSLKLVAAKHLEDVEEDSPDTGFCPSKLSEQDQHMLTHRHLCLTRDNETYEVSNIRGKCEVTLLCEEEDPQYYLLNDHKFFYSLVYDTSQKTLVEESGEIRIGPKYQADIPEFIDTDFPYQGNDNPEPECADAQPMWEPDRMSSSKVDRFMVLARSVGTFARAMISSRNQPSLCVSAAAASRDVTLFHAMGTLHRHDYQADSATFALVPQGGPLLCRDELENWTPEEVTLFENALVKWGKDFFEIQKQSLQWKSTKSLVEYYYMWKTTERYLRVKQQKHNEKNSMTLKQIRISISKSAQPQGSSNSNGSSNAGGPSATRTVGQASNGGQRPVPQNVAAPLVRHPEIEGRCEGCPATHSPRWHKWNASGSNDGTSCVPLCSECWDYWLKYAGLKRPTAHEATRSERRGEYKCPECDKTFSRKERLTSHQSSSHLPFPCDVKNCNKSFKSKAGAQRHLQSVHGVGELGEKKSDSNTKPFIVRPRATGIAARRFFSARTIRHSARRPGVALPCDNLALESGSFYPALSRPKGWWKVKRRRNLLEMIEMIGSAASRSRTVRSPTIAPNYSTHRGANSTVRARSAAIRLSRPGNEPPRIMPAGRTANGASGEPQVSSSATVAAYLAARQNEEAGHRASPAGASSQVVDLTGDAAGRSSSRPAKRAADPETVDGNAPAAKSPRVS